MPDTSADMNKKVRYYAEHPNFLYIYNSEYDNKHFDLVYLICPYSCNYLNDLHKTNKFKFLFCPTNNIKFINPKTIDVFYTGHNIHGLHAMEMSERAVIRKLGEGQFRTLKNYISESSAEGFKKKMELLSKTKIYLVHNLLLPKTRFPNYYSNDLTKKHLPWDFDNNPVPQVKSRMFEGALMGCILLAYKDRYKTIDRFFTENEEFIYFDSEADLNAKIDQILANYDTYKHIGENAQKRVRENYLTKNFSDIIAKDLGIST
jgi:hypothetical protein